MASVRLMSRLMRPEDEDVIASVRKSLKAAGLVSLEDAGLARKIQAVRMSVESIREADQAFNNPAPSFA